jgi:hypothetical protein
VGLRVGGGGVDVDGLADKEDFVDLVTDFSWYSHESRLVLRVHLVMPVEVLARVR